MSNARGAPSRFRAPDAFASRRAVGISGQEIRGVADAGVAKGSSGEATSDPTLPVPPTREAAEDSVRQVPADRAGVLPPGEPGAADSLGARLSGATGRPDSLRAFAPAGTGQADSIRVWRVLHPWDEKLEANRPAPILARAMPAFDRSTERVLREWAVWNLGLSRMRSGSPFTPDPIGRGDLPGREPVTPLVAGLPIAPPAFPETPPDGVGLAWLQGVRLRSPSPLRLPNNPTGGEILELDLLRPETPVAASGLRLSDGSYDSNTDGLYFVRPGGSGLFQLFWEDHKTAGRTIYDREAGQNLLFRYEHLVPWGRVAFGSSQQFARAKLSGSRRWLWDRSAYDLRTEAEIGSWSVDASSAVSWQRYAWEESGRNPKRKDTLVQTLVRAAGPGTSVRPLVTAQLDVNRLRFFEPGVLSLDRRDSGLGLAAGVGGVTNGWRYEASLGRSSPGLGKSGWTSALEVEKPVDDRWSVRVYLGRSLRPRLIPRLSQNLSTEVTQGLTAPRVEPDAPLESLLLGEIRVARRTEGRALGLTLRATQIDHAVTAEGGWLRYFIPAGYADLPDQVYDRTIRVLALHGDFEVRLPYGFRLEGWAAARTADPSWKEELWMTPVEARGSLHWSAQLFERDLGLDLFLRGHWTGDRATTGYVTPDAVGPEDIRDSVEPSDRFDGGATAQVRSFVLFFLMENLEDDIRESATIENGLWPLPRRSARIGLTWRFID